MKRIFCSVFLLLLPLFFIQAGFIQDTTLISGPEIAKPDTIVISKQTELKKDTSENKTLLNKNEKIQPQNFLAYFSFSKIFYSAIIFILAYVFLKIITKLFSIWAELNIKHRVTIKGFIPVIRIVVWIGAFTFVIVAIIKPPMATVLAFTASIGVAIGFASQDLLKNIFGGIIIVIDKPFKAGDKVKIGEYYGEIVEIGLRSTRLVTPDDNLVSVPNSEVMNQSVANANAGEDNCQVVTDFYLPLKTNIDKVKPIALEAAMVSRYVFLNKPVVVLFTQETIGHKIVLRMRIKAYVNDTRNEFKFKSDLTELLMKEIYQNEKLCEELNKFDVS